MGLFDYLPLAPEPVVRGDAPLAERMRPATLDDYVGQEHLLGQGKPLRVQMERDQLQSMILWGPPGTGKTSLARLIARLTQAQFIPFSAVMGGIKEIKQIMSMAEGERGHGKRTILFIDEIHRFNKAQQDAFLPYVERGDIVLIGATTENPSFEVNAALLSRTRVYRLEALGNPALVVLLRKAAGVLDRRVSDTVLERIATQSGGDARSAYGILESAAAIGGEIDEAAVECVLQGKLPLYDKGGEEHFNLISALQKSVRSSDPDAALYWLARMLEGGEDRMYLARRLVRMSIEDIGLADPRAVEQAMACQQTVHFLGEAEGDLALGQLAIYLAVAPKSDSSCNALGAARQLVRDGGVYGVPMQLRNAPTKAMKAWGYGRGYEHAHSREGGITSMPCMPEELVDKTFYVPSGRGMEIKMAERLDQIRRAKAEARVQVQEE